MAKSVQKFQLFEPKKYSSIILKPEYQNKKYLFFLLFFCNKRKSTLIASNDLFSISEPLEYNLIHNCLPDTLTPEEESCAILQEFTE
jgi:hypothetical protein